MAKYFHYSLIQTKFNLMKKENPNMSKKAQELSKNMMDSTNENFKTTTGIPVNDSHNTLKTEKEGFLC